jgi:hypothetical protein
MAKSVGQALATGPACAPFREHLKDIRSQDPTPTHWDAVADRFLRSMEVFDESVIAGIATEGERQNGKGDYFNDLLAHVLEQASDTVLSRRSGVAGLIFPNHSLDVTYPAVGEIIEVLVEAKMMGTPKHPGNPKAKPEGRPGSADMLKRCKEAGFKTIDLKAGFGYKLTQAGLADQEVISGSLTDWLRKVKPSSYLVFAVRVTNPHDFHAVIATATAMTQVMDRVGVYAYRPVKFSPNNLSPPRYEECPGTPQNLRLSIVLYEISQRLRTAASSAPTPVEVTQVLTPAQKAGGVLDLEEWDESVNEDDE